MKDITRQDSTKIMDYERGGRQKEVYAESGVAVETSKKLKIRNPSFTIVWGGMHPSLVPQQCLKDDFVDIVVIGEGEETAVDLAYSLKDGLKLENVKGIGLTDII